MTLELTGEEALVLFDWLARLNENRETPRRDDAEERVLFDLEAMLEQMLVAPLAVDYKEQLAAAKRVVLSATAPLR